MVSFTDNCNDISIYRLPYKTKIGKHSWYFNNSLLCKSEFCSATKTLKTQKNNHSLASDWWEYTKYCFKENAKTFPKNSTAQENIKIFRLKEDYKIYTKKKTSNQNQLENKKAKGAKHYANIR